MGFAIVFLGIWDFQFKYFEQFSSIKQGNIRAIWQQRVQAAINRPDYEWLMKRGVSETAWTHIESRPQMPHYLTGLKNAKSK